jgi:hypothetical protein
MDESILCLIKRQFLRGNSFAKLLKNSGGRSWLGILLFLNYTDNVFCKVMFFSKTLAGFEPAIICFWRIFGIFCSSHPDNVFQRNSRKSTRKWVENFIWHLKLFSPQLTIEGQFNKPLFLQNRAWKVIKFAKISCEVNGLLLTFLQPIKQFLR